MLIPGHVSYVMCHVSRVTCQASPVTFFCLFFLLLVFYLPSGGATRWRTCYQRGLPRLVSIHWALQKKEMGKLTPLRISVCFYSLPVLSGSSLITRLLRNQHILKCKSIFETLWALRKKNIGKLITLRLYMCFCSLPGLSEASLITLLLRNQHILGYKFIFKILCPLLK